VSTVQALVVDGACRAERGYGAGVFERALVERGQVFLLRGGGEGTLR
jgi:hypothetical protein